MQPIAFSDQSADSVTHNTVPDLFADGNADSVVIQVVIADINNKVLIGAASAGPVTPAKVFVFPERFHLLLSKKPHCCGFKFPYPVKQDIKLLIHVCPWHVWLPEPCVRLQSSFSHGSHAPWNAVFS